MDIEKIGVISAGSMGGMMSLLFAELGVEVNFYDPSSENGDALLEHAKEAELEDRVKSQKDYASLCHSLGHPKVFVFSLPHGTAGDATVESLHPFLQAGDVILDASNEHYENTERRQKILVPDGIYYIGMGVSGGYQSARHGPSISPGGDDKGLDLVLPFLQKLAAKDVQGRPCVQKMGPGGSGHYVKMIHNGIEHGMMSALCEVWGIMNQSLDMSYEQIASVFDTWKSSGCLLRNFLITIGADICRTKDPKDDTYVLPQVKDKTVQEGARLHASIPTLAAAHLFRLTSADSAQRGRIKETSGTDLPVATFTAVENSKETFLEDLHQATYAAFLLAFIQGLDLLGKANAEKGWAMDLCQRVYEDEPDIGNLLCNPKVAKKLQDCYPPLKNVVLRATEIDAYVPSLSASLEYLKYASSTDLPTQFMEAQLDYFGRHMFDLKAAGPGEHHFEWKPPRGRAEDS